LALVSFFPRLGIGIKFFHDAEFVCNGETSSRFIIANLRIRSGGITSHAGRPICLVDRNALDFSLMFHDVKSPTRPTLISQGVGVLLTLTQRDCPGNNK